MMDSTDSSNVQRRIINPWTWQDAWGYVQANEITSPRRVLICSGQLSTDADGHLLHASDMRGQIGQSLDNLETVLRCGRAGPERRSSPELLHNRRRCLRRSDGRFWRTPGCSQLSAGDARYSASHDWSTRIRSWSLKRPPRRSAYDERKGSDVYTSMLFGLAGLARD